MLEAYYDLACSPPSFDIIAFLAEVERERLFRGEDKVAITILPGPVGGFRDDRFWPHNTPERVAMLYRVAEPICWLLPSVCSVFIADGRDVPADGFGVGVSLYGLPRQVRCSAEGIRPLRPRTALPRDPSLVTITLRECEHWPERNSRIEEWATAARHIEALGWNVVFIRDARHAGEAMGPFRVDARASLDIAHRAALYASAAVNLGISNGPLWLALAMDAPVLMLRPTNDRLGGVFGAEQFERSGIPSMGQMPGAPAWQRLAWADDQADLILAAFAEFTESNFLVPTGAPKEWRTDISVTLASNTTALEAMENISSAMRRGLPMIGQSPAHDGHAVLVGGGPSLAHTLHEIVRRQKNGQTIFALNGAGKWLAERGVKPDCIVVLDARSTNAAFVGPDCSYLLASQCSPAVFDAAQYHDVRAWHFADPDLVAHITALDPGGWMTGGGITVGLTAMALVHQMGYRHQHLYGYDSSDAQGSAHAYAQAETRAEEQRLHVQHNGREFTCGAAMYGQARAFAEWAETLADDGAIITVHGDGLLPSIARQMHAARELEKGLAA